MSCATHNGKLAYAVQCFGHTIASTPDLCAGAILREQFNSPSKKDARVQDQFQVLGASLASASAANRSYEVAISSMVFLATGSSNPSAVRRASSARRRQYCGSSILGGVGM
jgi:hypothetical protein